jgi:hypothetical protein
VYEYLTPDQLKALATHEDPDVRHLVEDARQYAAELLRARFRVCGEMFFNDPEPPELPRLLWQTIQEGPQSLTEDAVVELDRLARAADGWWRAGDQGGMEFVSLAEWEADYEES